MPKFRCRTVLPKLSNWYVGEAPTPEEAANAFHAENVSLLPSCCYTHTEADGGKICIYFARIEVEGHETLVSRVYRYGLWRKGGVKLSTPTLADIAKKLEYKGDPKTLIESGWEFEESMEEARAGKLEVSAPWNMDTQQ